MLLSHADGSQELGELGAFSVAAIAKPQAKLFNTTRISETALSVNFFGNTHPHHHNLRVNGGPRFTAENELPGGTA
jgi:hypothetical protein